MLVDVVSGDREAFKISDLSNCWAPVMSTTGKSTFAFFSQPLPHSYFLLLFLPLSFEFSHPPHSSPAITPSGPSILFWEPLVPDQGQEGLRSLVEKCGHTLTQHHSQLESLINLMCIILGRRCNNKTIQVNPNTLRPIFATFRLCSFPVVQKGALVLTTLMCLSAYQFKIQQILKCTISK